MSNIAKRSLELFNKRSWHNTSSPSNKQFFKVVVILHPLTCLLEVSIKKAFPSLFIYNRNRNPSAFSVTA